MTCLLSFLTSGLTMKRYPLAKMCSPDWFQKRQKICSLIIPPGQGRDLFEQITSGFDKPSSLILFPELVVSRASDGSVPCLAEPHMLESICLVSIVRGFCHV